MTCTIAAGLAVNGTASFVIPGASTLAAEGNHGGATTVSGGGDQVVR